MRERCNLKPPREMQVVMDEDVKRVCEFMYQNLTTARLVAVAEGVAAVAPILRGRYPAEPVSVLGLQAPPIGAGDPQGPSADGPQRRPSSHLIGPCPGACWWRFWAGSVSSLTETTSRPHPRHLYMPE